MSGSIISSTAIDLSRLPPPDIIEALDYEAILASMRIDLIARAPGLDDLDETDPAIKLLEVAAYREFVLRQRINDAARGCMIAYAAGADLDQLAAFFGVERLTIVAATDDAPAQYESDAELRRRILLAPDGFTVAGPESAYVFHAKSASGDVLDAGASSPAPGEVIVSVLSRVGDGTATAALLALVDAAVGPDGVRPMSDQVTVASAQIVPFTIEAQLWIYAGPDAGLILQTSRDALDAYLLASRKLARDIPRTAIIAALHVSGVQRVDLISPAADVVIEAVQAAAAVEIAVTVAGNAL